MSPCLGCIVDGSKAGKMMVTQRTLSMLTGGKAVIVMGRRKGGQDCGCVSNSLYMVDPMMQEYLYIVEQI